MLRGLLARLSLEPARLMFLMEPAMVFTVFTVFTGSRAIVMFTALVVRALVVPMALPPHRTASSSTWCCAPRAVLTMRRTLLDRRRHSSIRSQLPTKRPSSSTPATRMSENSLSASSFNSRSSSHTEGKSRSVRLP